MEDLTSPRVLRETLSRYGLAPRKSLGQNFLIDRNLRDKIVEIAAPCSSDLVVEIGPGPGTLTAGLLATGASVLAVEIDPGLAGILSEQHLPPGQLVLVVGDILRLDLTQTIAEAGFLGRPCVAVANLPYYITTPVIFHLLQAPLPWQRMLLLIQREVAARVAALPGSKDYGLLSVMTQYRAKAEITLSLPPSVFWPPPKVHSALLRLTFPGPYRLSVVEERVLQGLARAAFGQRRKTLANACRSWAEGLRLRAGFPSVCRAVGIEPERRGEELAVADFVRLAKQISGEADK